MKSLRIFLLVLILMPATIYSETKVLFLGDSITAGYGLAKEEAYPSLIDKMLKKRGYTDVKIINGSISGSTSASSLSRLTWFARINPDILFLALGANDGLRGLPVENMEENLSNTITKAKEKGMKVILAGMKIPPNYGTEYSTKFEKVYFRIAKKHKVVLVPFLLEGVGGRPEFNLADGIHPNSEGQKIIAENVIRYIAELL